MASRDRFPDEETQLLQVKEKTPLPWNQISPVFVALSTEPISSAYIFPFINQLIGELGITGDDHKIGYYESLFFATEALTTWRWSLLSDFIGRRPVILLGLLGLSVSNFAFGLSRTLGMLIISRYITGVLSGNVGVMKSMLGDITDHTNMARVFTMVPAIFCMGVTIACVQALRIAILRPSPFCSPLYGGALAKPQERWPHIFPGEFWKMYPYFLPSFTSGCFTLLAFSVCATFMKESLPSKLGKRPPSESSTVENPVDDPPMQPVSMWTLLKTYSVLIPTANYGILGLLDIGIIVLMPLFYSSPIEIGGLGFSPPIIGTFLAIFGIVDGSVQALFGTKLIQWFGARKVFCWAVFCFYPVILLFPVMSAVVTAQGKVGPIIWIFMTMQLIFMVLMDISFPVVFMFVTKAAPNKQSLGSVNGLSQSFTSAARAIGPALTTSLFAFSKEYNVLGGNLVYVILVILATILVLLSRCLPNMKNEE